MKFLHLTFHFEYGDRIEEILDRHEIKNFVRYPMIEAKDRDGKHYGSQVYPGNTTVVQAQVQDETVEELMSDLKEFKESKETHRHLEALILPIESRLV